MIEILARDNFNYERVCELINFTSQMIENNKGKIKNKKLKLK